MGERERSESERGEIKSVEREREVKECDKGIG